MKKSKNISIFIGLTLILIMGLNPLCGSFLAYGTVTGSEQTGLNFFFNNKNREISIIYDSSDKITKKVASEINNVLEQSGSDVHSISVSSMWEFRCKLNRPSWITVYVFHGAINGMKIGSQTIPWEKIGYLVDSSSSKYHIVEACYSEVLEKTPDNLKIRGIGSRIDAEHAIFDALGQILELYDNLGDKEHVNVVRKMAPILHQRLMTKMPELVLRAIYPLEPLDIDDFLVNMTNDDSLIRG
ncbi:MAG: hypothetical protein ACFFBD_03465, partial [Candidatus Hodarchaeota archaeon]